MTSTDYLVMAEISRVAFESGPDAVIVVNDAGNIVAVNQRAEFLTGRPRKDLLGQPVEELIPQPVRDLHREHRKGYLSMPNRRLMGPDLDLSILQRVAGGEERIPVDVNLAPAVLESIGTVVVATIRTRGGWGGTTSQ